MKYLIATMFALIFTACGDNTTTPLLKDIISLTINDTNITMHSTDAPKTITATVTYTDGSTADATTSILWTSTDSDVLKTSLGELTPGISNGGNVTIQATYEQYGDSTTATISKLTDYNASFPDINATGTYVFQAYGNFDNGDTNVSIFSNIVWSADNSAVIDVTNNIASITLYAGDTNVTATVFGDTNTSSPIAPQSKIYTIN
ncbi:hypothetical protein [Sulfurimonas sp.]